MKINTNTNPAQTYRTHPFQYFIVYGWLNCLIASIVISPHATAILKGIVINSE
jgi:hypothetical protein